MKGKNCAFLGDEVSFALTPAISLRRAIYCENCEAVFDRSASSRCPHCNSASTFPLGRWIKSPLLNSRIINPASRGW